MVTVFQKVNMNTVYEVCVDTNTGNVMIFRDGSYWKSAYNVELALLLINGSVNI